VLANEAGSQSNTLPAAIQPRLSKVSTNKSGVGQ